MFPDGIGPVECVNVEHEEVLLIPRWVDCNRVTFKYGLGDEFIGVLETLAQAWASTPRTQVRVGEVEVSPRDVVAAVLPNPAELGDLHARQDVRRHVGDGHRHRRPPRARCTSTTWSTTPRRWREYGNQAVVWQTAVNPVVALELLASGAWKGNGVLGPEAFDAVPYLDLLAAYGSHHGMVELGEGYWPGAVRREPAPVRAGAPGRAPAPPAAGAERSPRRRAK